jgi:hypothetical protein
MSLKALKIWKLPYDRDNTIPASNDVTDKSCDETTFGKLVIVVTDSGVGLSQENQKHLFMEVVQFRPKLLHAGGGSGLGLWITNNIMKMHDGKISVSSAGEGTGCSFTLEIDMKRKGESTHRVLLFTTPIITPPITPITTATPDEFVVQRDVSFERRHTEPVLGLKQLNTVPVFSKSEQMHLLVVLIQI